MFLKQYSAVIFDLDGTLADSMQVWDTVLPDWASERGFALPAGLEEEIRLMSTGQTAAHVCAALALAETPQEIKHQWEALVVRRYRQEVQPKPGAVELVGLLHQRGVPMALATSCVPEACQGFLRRTGLGRHLTEVLYTQDHGKDKTHPDLYRACAAALNMAPERCVVLEDILPALQGVRAAGMGFVAVYDKSSAGDWCTLQREADLAVDSLRQLLD